MAAATLAVQRLLVVLAVAGCGALPQLGDEPSEYGVVTLVEEAVGDMEASGEQAAEQDVKLTYAGTLQHVVNRFCTERVKKKGAIFCDEMVALQNSWVDAEGQGTMDSFTKLLGMMQAHYCPKRTSTDDARCLVLTLLEKGIPVSLKWNANRKRYLQLTKDIAAHYCKMHGENALFCPLMKALKTHYFNAVVRHDGTRFVKYVTSLKQHYCDSEARMGHPADERCNIFPLLLHAMPGMGKQSIDGKVLSNTGKHATPGDPPGNVPAVDEGLFKGDDDATETSLPDDSA